MVKCSGGAILIFLLLTFVRFADGFISWIMHEMTVRPIRQSERGRLTRVEWRGRGRGSSSESTITPLRKHWRRRHTHTG